MSFLENLIRALGEDFSAIPQYTEITNWSPQRRMLAEKIARETGVTFAWRRGENEGSMVLELQSDQSKINHFWDLLNAESLE